jgi:FixJ family two-component response regulator
MVSQTASDVHFWVDVRVRWFPGLEQGKKVGLPNTVISIVDDDPSFREATKGLLKLLGYATASFASAEEFLKSDRLHDSSCVITDVQMPGMNGVELQCRLIAEGHGLPVIFMTAYPEEAVSARVLKKGACGYLRKPLDKERLLGCLTKALNSREPGSAAI